ncbi:MAG: SCP-like extracellular [Bacteroidetes bacterium]|nr:SCP-like extracellular [Bacteroidota bacterium]MBS1541521.1 SCP-like extracellular [Bacteroidota bacterium]
MQNAVRILAFVLLSFQMVAGQQVPAVTGSKISQEDAQKALDFHNRARKEVGTQPLVWSAELAAYAQAWADHLANGTCEMEHRPHEGEWKQVHGENIYWGSSAGSFSVLSACEGWYGEIKDYHHEAISRSNFRQTGHYTQMVWKNTQRVGIARAVCQDGALIIVANYDPPGNYIGEKAY